MTRSEAFPLLSDLRWSDCDAVAAAAVRIFDVLCADRHRELRRLLGTLSGATTLLPLCERLDFMDKLVVWEERNLDVRIRLHVFRPGYSDRPHNHRFTFASRILAGAYRHDLYGHESLLGDTSHEWQPLVARMEEPGSQYVMHHDAVHRVVAAEPTLSLVLRGPIVKATSVIVDRITGQRTTLVSVARERADLRMSKAMPEPVVAHTITSALALLGGGAS
jgi:hypothetical protein